MKIKITFTEEVLGTKAANKDIFQDFIASKHPSGTPQHDELDNAEHREEAGTTIFHREKELPGIYDYQIKGFFKDACGSLNRMDKEYRGNLEKLTAYKTKIDGCIFVTPRFIPFIIATGVMDRVLLGICERPLKADTAQGPRVSLCRSETVPAGTSIVFDIQILAKELVPYVRLFLDYGKFRGLGQWRNSGKGRFTWEEIVKQYGDSEAERRLVEA